MHHFFYVIVSEDLKIHLPIFLEQSPYICFLLFFIGMSTTEKVISGVWYQGVQIELVFNIKQWRIEYVSRYREGKPIYHSRNRNQP